MTANLCEPGIVLSDRYAIIDNAGEGGMGFVYRGHDRNVDCQVAIKVMRPEWVSNKRVVERFANECRVLERIDHPQVSRLLASGHTATGLPYMILEWIEGIALGRLRKATRLLSLARIARLCNQLLRALDATHGCGVVHGDLKPDNVLVVSHGPRESIKLIDFGLAHLDSLPARGPESRGEGAARDVCGTPEYMAPELISGATPTPAIDLYAVGVLLYELLTGDAPFTGGSPADVMTRHLNDRPVRPSLRCPERVLPPALDDVILCALAKLPGERPGSARAMAETLALAFASAGVMPDRRCTICDAPVANQDGICSVCNGDDGTTTARVAKVRRNDSPTRPDTTSAPAVGLPGSHSEPPHLWRLRQSIGEALEHGHPDEAMRGYHALAVALAQVGLLFDAVRELEEGIDVVSLGADPEASSQPLLWQLLLAQSDLYLRLHLPEQARIRAAQAVRQAATVRDAAGGLQGRQLLANLEGGQLETESTTRAAVRCW